MCPITSDNPPLRRIAPQLPETPCHHCQTPCRSNYEFCFRCCQQLPDTLRCMVTRYFDSRRNPDRRRKHELIISEARGYLRADDRTAFMWERAWAGEFWAEEALQDLGEIPDFLEFMRERAARREAAKLEGK